MKCAELYKIKFEINIDTGRQEIAIKKKKYQTSLPYNEESESFAYFGNKITKDGRRYE